MIDTVFSQKKKEIDTVYQVIENSRTYIYAACVTGQNTNGGKSYREV